MQFSRVWAMPNKDTFSIQPIGALVKRYLTNSQVSVDPFARNKDWATWTNDLNPNTTAKFHLDAEEFAKQMCEQQIKADVVIFDPPYSTRQIKECYEGIGLKMPYERTIGWGKLKTYLAEIVKPNGIALSFGWNSIGFGIKRGFQITETMLVSHGKLHNDTICTVERKTQSTFDF